MLPPWFRTGDKLPPEAGYAWADFDFGVYRFLGGIVRVIRKDGNSLRRNRAKVRLEVCHRKLSYPKQESDRDHGGGRRLTRLRRRRLSGCLSRQRGHDS